MGRSPRCSRNEGLNRAAWTSKEDMILRDYINIHGVKGSWRSVRDKTGLNRSSKSCTLRWMNYLRPNIKRGNISTEEDELIVRLHRLLGNRWSLIAGRLPGRTDNEIKNYWNTHLRKKIGRLNKSDPMEAKMKEDRHFSAGLDRAPSNQIAVNIENNTSDVHSFDEESRRLLEEDSIMNDFIKSREVVSEHNGIMCQGVIGLDSAAFDFPLSPISSPMDFQTSYLFSTAGHW